MKWHELIRTWFSPPACWDVFAFLGVALLTAGTAWIYPPLGLLTPGLAFLALGVMGARAGAQEMPPDRKTVKQDGGTKGGG